MGGQVSTLAVDGLVPLCGGDSEEQIPFPHVYGSLYGNLLFYLLKDTNWIYINILSHLCHLCLKGNNVSNLKIHTEKSWGVCRQQKKAKKKRIRFYKM